MASNKNKPHAQDNSHHGKNKRFPFNWIRNRRQSVTNEINSENRTQENNNINENEDMQRQNGKDKPKWTDVGGLVTNIILAVATIFLFREATNQSEISKQSADAATTAVNEQKRNDSILLANEDSARKSATTESIKRSKHENEVFDLQKKGVAAQTRLVAAQTSQLRETLKEFIVTHQPLLTYERKTDTLPNYYFAGELTIVNVGFAPAHIISVEYKGGGELGADGIFLNSVLSPNYMGSIPIKPHISYLFIEPAAEGFDFRGEYVGDEEMGHEFYYYNNLKDKYIVPNAARIMLKETGLARNQFLAMHIKIKYLNNFSDTLVLNIP